MNTELEVSNLLSGAKSFLRLISMAALLMVAVSDVALGVETPSTDIIASATKFMDLLVKEDFAGAVARFDTTMKNALPEPKMREVWQTLQKQVGPFEQRLRARTDTAGGYDVVFVTCHFEEADLDAKVVFNADKQITGLFFVPSQDAPGSFAPPPYAKASAFHEKEFTVGSGEWSLPGTLTLPVGLTHPAPVVVLVHGSGPNDRDETIMANKPFRDLAWGLATKGIAVLRYEKRTKEHQAKFVGAELSHLTVKEESIDDAMSAAAQLRTTDGVDPKRIFVLGHSLGGTLAPRIGQADPNLAGLIILAGATRPLEDLMVEQTRYLLSLQGKPTEEGQAKLDELLVQVANVKKLTAADASSSSLLLHAPPLYWLDLREHDPLTAVKTLQQPLLVLQGGRDYQVTEADFDGWKNALDARQGVTFKLYPELNHLFMAGEGKSTPAEYEHPGHVAESVINDIAEWILKTNPIP
jgi:dienelactone hydrolase